MLVIYALRTHMWKLDRFFKIYVADRAIYGAYLSAQVYDERSARTVTSDFGPLMKKAQRELARKAEREARYDAMDLSTPAFTAADPRNFVIPRSEIRDTSLRVRFSAWILARGGRLTIDRADAAGMSFLLPPSQHETTADALHALHIARDRIDAFADLCKHAPPQGAGSQTEP